MMKKSSLFAVISYFGASRVKPRLKAIFPPWSRASHAAKAFISWLSRLNAGLSRGLQSWSPQAGQENRLPIALSLIGRETEAPQWQRTSMAFTSLKSTAITLLGVIRHSPRGAIIALVCCASSLPSFAQVSPFQGLGNAQFFDNNGHTLTAGVLYSFQAGTSTQQATYSDSTGTIQNPNPIPFGSGARVGIWLTSGAFYKFVLCAQNDGPACAASDVLFSVDQVPGSPAGSGGDGGSPFISGSANPATSGILRLASSDSICWRNQANSANLCVSKDTSDVLAWPGSFKLQEGVCSTTGLGFDYLCGDSTAHRFKQCPNGTSCTQIANAGVDINISDQVIQFHFGSTATPLSGTAPTSKQFLQWDGTHIVGANPPAESFLTWCAGPTGATCSPAGIAFAESGANTRYGNEVLFTNAHTIIRFTYNSSGGTLGCSTQAVIGVRDITSSTNLTTATIANGEPGGFVDSGVLSIATTAGHKLMVGTITGALGCSTAPLVNNVMAVYQ